MIDSKPWDWNKVEKDVKHIWLTPSEQAYYLVDRWMSQNKKDFLDLGCGLGRHTLLFSKAGFNVSAFDLSEEAILSTKSALKKQGLKAQCKQGDMLHMPYKDETFDAILSYNVISHTDTEGVNNIIKEIYRILKPNGEIFLTLCSKNTWAFKQKEWPLVDKNTRIRKDDSPEYNVPHFYADYKLILKLFKNFEIIKVSEVKDFFDKNGKPSYSYHYHILLKK